MRDFRIDVNGYMRTIPRAAFRPADVLREIVANALQSCALASAKESTHKARIDVENPGFLLLQVTDNGIGFDPSVLEELGNIQTSKWPKAAGTLDVPVEEHTPYGRFGMGLTSTINISDQILIITRPHRFPDRTYCWWTDWKTGWIQWSDQEALPADLPENVVGLAQRHTINHIGARVLLKLTDDAWAGPNPWKDEYLAKLVRYYFSAVPVPIHVGGQPAPVNTGVKGWPTHDCNNPEEIIGRWLKSRNLDLNEKPQNRYHCFNIDPSDGVSGVIWIKPYGHDTVHFFALEIYGSDIHSLLPYPGNFFSAVVNDNKAILDITKGAPQIATIEGARREEEIRSAIVDALTRYVRWLNEEFKTGDKDTKETIYELGRRYGRHLLGCLANQRTAQAHEILKGALEWVAVPLIVPGGKRTLPNCELPDDIGTGRVIYFAKKDTDLSRKQLFSEKYIVDARHENDWGILQLYQFAHASRGVRIQLVTDPTGGFIKPLTEQQIDEGGWKLLLQEVSSLWESGGTLLAEVDERLGKAFAHVVKEENTSRRSLVMNVNNDGLSVLRTLSIEGIQAAAHHIVNLSDLLDKGEVSGEEFNRISEHLTALVLELSRTRKQD